MKNKAFNACKMLNTLLGRLSAKERNTVSIIFIKKRFFVVAIFVNIRSDVI